MAFTQCLAEIVNGCTRLANVLSTEFGENSGVAGGRLPQTIEYLAS